MNLQEIATQYPYRVELHTHTSPVSACAHVTAEETVRRYAARGVDALVITNHLNPLWQEGDPKARALEYLADIAAAREEGKKCGVTVILGVEIRFTENHNDYLVYGVTPDEIEKMIPYLDRGIEAFYADFKREDNLILQAHPFRKGMELCPLHAIDGIEVFNMHPGHNSRIAVAAQYATDHNMVISGGSDYHEEGKEALCLFRTRTLPTDSFQIAEILKSRDYCFDISGFIVFPQ